MYPRSTFACLFSSALFSSSFWSTFPARSFLGCLSRGFADEAFDIVMLCVYLLNHVTKVVSELVTRPIHLVALNPANLVFFEYLGCLNKVFR